MAGGKRKEEEDKEVQRRLDALGLEPGVEEKEDDIGELMQHAAEAAKGMTEEEEEKIEEEEERRWEEQRCRVIKENRKKRRVPLTKGDGAKCVKCGQEARYIGQGKKRARKEAERSTGKGPESQGKERHR